jgi:hypothetical protein
MDGGVDAGMIEMRRCGRRVARRAEMFLCTVFWFGSSSPLLEEGRTSYEVDVASGSSRAGGGTGQEWSVGGCALFSPKARRWGAMSALRFRLSRIGQQSRITRGPR